MTNHAILVGIRDSAAFELFHGRESAFDFGRHLVEECIFETHPADIHRESKIVVAKKILLKPVPEGRITHFGIKEKFGAEINRKKFGTRLAGDSVSIISLWGMWWERNKLEKKSVAGGAYPR